MDRFSSFAWFVLSKAVVALLLLPNLASAAEPASAAAIPEPPITVADREHWAFQPLADPELPAVEQPHLVANPIDRFVMAKLEEAGLDPMPPADRVTLIRRVTFDLTGLPPTPDEVDAFLADGACGAYERLVDRLLASPAYGERWAQHWLDLARFAESDGFEFDAVRPEAWRYRDWVIDALNHDMPYDEFLRLQLAGDELRPGKRDAAVATGFVLCGPDMPDINLQQERRDMVLSEVTGTVGAVFLGLQIGCARCHDHKYDPVSQGDFYRLRAFFDPVTLFEDHEFGRVLREPADDPPASHLLIRGDFRRLGPEVQPAYPRIANLWDEPVNRLATTDGSSGRRAALARWLTRADHPLTTRVIVNRIWQHHFGRGLVGTPSDFGLMGDEPTHPELLDWLAAELVRRGWSLKAMHKLMATSAAYRRASHMQLNGWSGGWGKAQRAPANVIGERAAAGASQAQPPAIPLQNPSDTRTDELKNRWRKLVKADPENRLLGRMNRRRLEGEAIRDAMLAAADRLSPRRGGRGVMPPLPEELVGTLLKGQWEVAADEEDHRRRSIYLFVRRNLRYPLFETFDRPDTNASCPRRSRSTIAPQALMLLNSQLSLDAARGLAGYVLTHSPRDEEAWINLCYRRSLSRFSSDEELADARAFLEEQRRRLTAEGRSEPSLAVPQNLPSGIDPTTAAALTDLCLVLFNLNEFVYVD